MFGTEATAYPLFLQDVYGRGSGALGAVLMMSGVILIFVRGTGARNRPTRARAEGLVGIAVCAGKLAGQTRITLSLVRRPR